MEKIYDVDYFIKKFESRKLTVGSQGCAYAWCNLWGYDKDQAIALSNLFRKYFPMECKESDDKMRGVYHNGVTWFVVLINDGTKTKYKQSTPELRILAALYDIKKLQQPAEEKPKVIHEYHVVKVSESLIEQATELINN